MYMAKISHYDRQTLILAFSWMYLGRHRAFEVVTVIFFFKSPSSTRREDQIINIAPVTLFLQIASIVLRWPL